MFKVAWDRETGGVKLSSLVGKDTISIPPRPVFYEELNLLGLNTLGWNYPECEEPLLWACNRSITIVAISSLRLKERTSMIKQPLCSNPAKEKYDYFQNGNCRKLSFLMGFPNSN